MYRVRVENRGFKPNGVEIRMDKILTVTDAIYKEWGPSGKTHLSFIQDLGPDNHSITAGARKLAKELGVNLRTLDTNHNRIQASDIREAQRQTQ